MYGMDVYQALFGHMLADIRLAQEYGAREGEQEIEWPINGETIERRNAMPVDDLRRRLLLRNDSRIVLNDGWAVGETYGG